MVLMSDDGLRMRYSVKLIHIFRDHRIERNKDDEDNDTALVLVIDEECTHHRIPDNSLNTDGADENRVRKRGIERNKEDDNGGIAQVLIIDEEYTHHHIINNGLNNDGATEIMRIQRVVMNARDPR